MKKLIAGFAASLDGYIEGPNGEYDWILIDKEIDFAEQAKRYDTYFFGRKSYEAVLKMGNKSMPGISNYVFSNTLDVVDKNYQLVKGDIRAKVTELKNKPGKDIAVFGGASLLSSLLDLQLVDEINIAIIPVLIGKGKPMVDVLKNKVWLHLLSSKTYSNGTVMVVYDIKKESLSK
jgi:dihydrofolate reductase